MTVTVDGLIARYGAEVARLTQRAVLAAARADAAEARLAEQDEPEA